MAAHSANGDDVHILIMAEGLTSRSSSDCENSPLIIKAQLSELGACAEKAGQTVGAKSVELLGFPDNRMDSLTLLEIIKPIEAKIAAISPEFVYTHQPGCLNIDHQLTHKATVTAARSLPGSCIKTLLFFEGISSTEWQVPGGAAPFVPNWFVNIEHTLNKKIAALQVYDAEMRQFPHPRSYEAVSHLAAWRGATAGYAAAEAFSLGRHRT